MSRMAVIIFGHSHITSVASALAERDLESCDPNSATRYFLFDLVARGSGFQFCIDSGGGAYVFHPDLRRLVDSHVPSDCRRVYISMFGGNAHNALTLLEHPEPFDFILPEESDRPRIANARLLPFALVKAFISRLAEPYLLTMACLRNAFPELVLHIESPPPIGDNQFVLDNLERYFLDQSSLPKVAPRELRYKLWRVHSTIVSSYASALGVELIASPDGSRDEDGFLIKEDWGNDSTHAGKNYGLRLVKQIESHVDAPPYGGWNWF